MKPTYENHALTKAEGCYHCNPLVQQRDELAAQVERFKSVVEAVAHIGVDFGYGAYEIQTDTIDLARGLLSENPPAALAALKAQWQAEALGDFYDHLQGMALRNGWGTDSDAYNVSEELKYWCQHAQEAGDA